MIVTITADGSRLTVQQPILADGTAGSVRVRFCMDADWAGLTLTAVFRTPRGDILMPLTDGACDLPAAATEKCGSVLVGVFGTDGTRTLTSTFCRLRISPGVPTEGETAENYTPGLYEQFAAKFARFENMTADAVAGEDANVAVQEKDGALCLHFTLPQGEKGDTGEQGPQGEKGDTGAQGPQGEKGDKGEKGDSPEIVQQVGGSEQAVMSQKAVTDAFAQFVATDAIADGINMLDITTCTPGKIMTGTGAVKDHDSYMLTDYIKVEAGKTYSFYLGAIGDTYCYPGYMLYCANFDATKKLISSDNGGNHKPYTVPDGVSYIRASVSSSAAYGERMICEYAGDGVPLEYSPYSGHTELRYRTNDLGFITPEMFGAVGDGTTDDHAAFQACFNASAGKTILIGNKKYYLSAPIKLDKDIFTYTVQGFANATAYVTAERGYIMCGADFLDGTNDDGYEEEYNICLRNMQFISADADGGYAWLKNIRNSNGMIEQCTVANFGYAIYGGMCDRAIISNSTFFGIGKAFICEGDNDRTWTSAGITDSSIVNCYVNGAPSKNPSVFILSTAFSASVIENCYFDFFKDAICPVMYEDEDGYHYQQCNYSGTVFLGCTFEIFWRIVRASIGNYEENEETRHPTPLRFVSCFFHCVSQTYMHSFTNADDEMKNADGTYTKFGVVVQDVSEENVRKLALRNIVLENNVFDDVEYPIYIDDADGECLYRNISESGSIMNAPYGKVPNGVFFCAPICEADAKTVYFESMNGKDYTALPEVTTFTDSTYGTFYKLNGCFEGMKIFYNGKPAIMHDLKWQVFTDYNDQIGDLESILSVRTAQQFNKDGAFTVQNMYNKADGSAISHATTRVMSFPMTVEEGCCVVVNVKNADQLPGIIRAIYIFASDACPVVGGTYTSKISCTVSSDYNDHYGYIEDAAAGSYMNIGVYCDAGAAEDAVNEALEKVIENLMVVKYSERPDFMHPDYESYYTLASQGSLAAVQETTEAIMRYGVKWSESNPDDLGTRCFNAEGLKANIGVGSSDGYSDFDTIYPWCEMKRCNIKTNANGASVVTYEGEDGFALDGSNGDVFVRIPKFTVERYTKDGYAYRVIGNPNAPVHEAFVENGKILDEIFIGAFEGYIDADSKLRSVENVIPTSNEIPSTYLTSANANGENYSLYDMRCVDAVWTLMAVEFGCRNTNQIIGYGLANFMQPVIGDSILVVKEAATDTNSVTVGKFTNTYKQFMPVGSNITICDTDQRNIVAQRKITNVEDTSDGLYTVFTFDGTGIDVNTNCFIGSAAFNTNFCELCSEPLEWHTGRAEFVSGSTTRNPIRYRWIENVVGNLWHFLPDITFNSLQMYVCKDMQKYQFHKYTDEYKPVGDALLINLDNGSKLDDTGVNYWIDSLLNDTFAKSVLFGKSYNTALTSTQAFGGYYYLSSGVMCIANGGGFEHLYRCNMLTQRAWIDAEYKWYLCGARLMFKKIN